MAKQHSRQTVFLWDLTALNDQQRERHQQVLEQLQGTVQEVRDVSQRYLFRHPAEISVLVLLAEFINLEHRGAPFLDFTLPIGSGRGPARLTLTGPRGVKEFLRAELGFDGILF
jgi:hypothetical protein